MLPVSDLSTSDLHKYIKFEVSIKNKIGHTIFTELLIRHQINFMILTNLKNDYVWLFQ